MDERNTDVLILGGGVIGLACALLLLKDRRAVTVLDKGRVGAATSHGNCGTITPSHAPPLAMPGMIVKALRDMMAPDAPFYLKPRFDPALAYWLMRFAANCNWRRFNELNRAKAPLLERSRDLLAELVAHEHLDCEFEQKGTLYVFRDLKAFEATQWLPKALGEVGIPIESVDGKAARALEPALNDSIVAGFFNPRDAHLRPDKFCAALAKRVRELGGVIVEDTEVTGFERDHNALTGVKTNHGDWYGNTTVFALGAWSPLLAKQLDLRIPIQPGKGYSITFDRPKICPRMPVVLKERSVCVTSWDSGFRLGSTMEFSGYDSSFNRPRLAALTRGAAEYLHEPHGPNRLEEWYGWRPMTWDDQPIIGRAPNLSNVVLATGHGMLGVTMAAVTAQLVTEIVGGHHPSLDISACSPARFH